MSARTALLALAVGTAGLLGGAGTASAACEPLLDPDFCPGIAERVEDLRRTVNHATCMYHPDLGYIGCA